MKPWRKWCYGLLILGGVVLAIRIALPMIVLKYVNHTLDAIPDYEAGIGDIDLHLWRGAYQIHNLRLSKRSAADQEPLLAVPELELSIQWRALFQGELVAVAQLESPCVVFIRSKQKNRVQLGFSREWMEQAKKLFPFQFNQVVIQHGTFRYIDDATSPPLHCEWKNCHLIAKNIHNSPQSHLLTELTFEAHFQGRGDLFFEMSGNINRDPPDFTAKTKLENLDLKQLNSFALHYAGFDFESGSFSFYSEVTARNGSFKGYIKPLLDQVGILDLKKDFQNPFTGIWQALCAGIAQLFQNQIHDRIATEIPLSGTLYHPKYGLWVTIANTLKNAFVRVYEPGWKQSGSTSDEQAPP